MIFLCPPFLVIFSCLLRLSLILKLCLMKPLLCYREMFNLLIKLQPWLTFLWTTFVLVSMLGRWWKFIAIPLTLVLVEVQNQESNPSYADWRKMIHFEILTFFKNDYHALNWIFEYIFLELFFFITKYAL